VWLDLCAAGGGSVCGSHTTKLELHNNDHSLYTCGGSCPSGISTTVTYTVDPTAAACGDGGTSGDAASE
jgi:hypothetical protein